MLVTRVYRGMVRKDGGILPDGNTSSAGIRAACLNGFRKSVLCFPEVDYRGRVWWAGGTRTVACEEQNPDGGVRLHHVESRASTV